MTLAELAEREAEKLRADGRGHEPASAHFRHIRVLLDAYERRPPCPLTPVVLALMSDVAGVNIDCGWHMVACGYQIKVRRVDGAKKYGAERFVSGAELEHAEFVTSIWTRNTIDAVDTILGSDGPLTAQQAEQIRRCISEQTRVQRSAVEQRP